MRSPKLMVTAGSRIALEKYSEAAAIKILGEGLFPDCKVSGCGETFKLENGKQICKKCGQSTLFVERNLEGLVYWQEWDENFEFLPDHFAE